MSDLPENHPGHRFAARELIEAFGDHDALGLRGLTRAGRAEQLAARRALYEYVTDLWHHAKRVGEQPGADPAFTSVAALRTLTDALFDAAFAAQADAGEV